ncbi:MAG TPA: hypothetical protein VL383_15795 [Gemmatimonadaceae bacterium]|jgi:hypothetical protein|nr:hypothetical protein [Gemmatimonadaceae bacterium]
MRSIIMSSIAAAAVAFTTACSSTDSVAPTTTAASARRTVSADAEGVTTRSRPIDQYIWFSCGNGGAGETIHVTGELHWEVERFRDSSGVYHFNFKSATYDLTGVGLTDGTVFRGLMTEHISTRAEDYLNEDIRTADIIRFVAPGSGESYSLMAGSHFVVQDGDYVLWDQTYNEVCR